MLENYLTKKIKDYLPFEPTEEQNTLISLLGTFLMSNDSDKVFLLKGYAGTVKHQWSVLW